MLFSCNKILGKTAFSRVPSHPRIHDSQSLSLPEQQCSPQQLNIQKHHEYQNQRDELRQLAILHRPDDLTSSKEKKLPDSNRVPL